LKKTLDHIDHTDHIDQMDKDQEDYQNKLTIEIKVSWPQLKTKDIVEVVGLLLELKPLKQWLLSILENWYNYQPNKLLHVPQMLINVEVVVDVQEP